MKLNNKCLSSLSVVVIAFCTSVNAAVTLVDTHFDIGNTGLVDEGGGVFSYTFDSTDLTGFSASGSDKLVAGIINKDTGAVAGPIIQSVTYDGAALSLAVQATTGSNRSRNSIFYLDNVTSDGDLVITFNDSTPSNQTGWAFGLYALDGTAVGVFDFDNVNGTGTGDTVEVTTDTGFVLNVWSRNNGGLELILPSEFTEDLDASAAVSGGGLVALLASSVTSSAGTYGSNVSGTNSTAGMVAASFNAAPVAIPEPSSTFLLSLGLLAMMTRRKR